MNGIFVLNLKMWMILRIFQKNREIVSIVMWEEKYLQQNHYKIHIKQNHKYVPTTNIMLLTSTLTLMKFVI